MTKFKNSIFPLEQENVLHVYQGSNFMLLPSAGNKHIHELTGKANI